MKYGSAQQSSAEKKVLTHAWLFTGYQIILIPAAMASVVGIGAAVCSGIRI
jgi:hypothetical protein